MQTMHKTISLISSVMLSAAAFTAVAADANTPAQPGSRLDRIRTTGTLVLAYRENAIPFSYIYNGTPIGFGADISKAIATDLQEKLGLRELNIRWNAVTLSTRIPLIMTNTVDLECATTTHTRDRANRVGFSHTFYVSQEGSAQRSGTPKTETGKIAAVEATTTIDRLRAQGQNVVAVRSNRNGMLALSQGQVDAFAAAMPLLASERLYLGTAGQSIDLTANSDAVPEAFACMLPKGDAAFLAQVNATLERLMRSGEMAKLHDRWFNQGIPPSNRSLNLPMNKATQDAYTSPNSTPFE